MAPHAARRFTTCTASGATARSIVDALTLHAVTRTLLLLHTWQSSTKAMLLVSSVASAKSPRRAPGTVTSPLPMHLRSMQTTKAGNDRAHER